RQADRVLLAVLPLHAGRPDHHRLALRRRLRPQPEGVHEGGRRGRGGSEADRHPAQPDQGELTMEFGYFTLSDNHYPNNPRSANEFVLQIREQALLADKLGMHSAWIGEHHFDSLGVNSRPDLLLANIASQTKNIRLAPAVTVLPLHHPVHVAEMWA